MNATDATEALLARLREKYSHRPTPSSLAEFEEENPEFAENKKEIAAFLKREYGATPLNYLRQCHLISQSSRQSSVPPEALPRGGGAKRPDDITAATNANLLKYTLCIISVLDWWVNNPNSPAYVTDTTEVYRIDKDGGPGFSAPERTDQNKLFADAVKAAAAKGK